MSKRTLLLLSGFLLLVGIGSYWLFFAPSESNTSVDSASDALFGWKFPADKFPFISSHQDLKASSALRESGGKPQGLPVRLKIPSLGLDAAIEDAHITPEGRMDVPAGSVNVAWFALGPPPGQKGSAVIGGHFGISNGVPFVFYKLDTLKIGDRIYVVDDKGNTLAFQVRSIRIFDRDADATSVFISEDGLAHLNLITCEGIWNRVGKSYPQRRVVFTDAVSTANAGEIVSSAGDPIAATVVFAQALGMGARGIEVVNLQTLLVQKGWLIMPRGVAPGYFGALTRAAVARYQASVGLPADGVFNAVTRARLVSE